MEVDVMRRSQVEPRKDRVGGHGRHGDSERKVTPPSPPSKPLNRLYSSDSKAASAVFHLTPTSSSRHSSPSFGPSSPTSIPVSIPDTSDIPQTTPDPQQIEKAKDRFARSAGSLTSKKLTELRNYNPPLPELESVCLGVLAVLMRVDPTSALLGQSYTWKSFLGYLQQPVQTLKSLKTAVVSLETGVIDRGKASI